MFMLRRVRRLRLIAASVFLAAAVVNGFGYPLTSSAVRDADFDVAAYALPDGTLPILCLGPGSDQESGTGHEHCDACLLVSAPLLGVANAEMAASPVVTTGVTYETQTGPAIWQPTEPAHRPRAPPSVFLT